MKKNTKIIIGVVAVVLIGGAIFGGGEEVEKVETKDKTAEVKKEEKKENKKFFVGDTVKYDDMQVTVQPPQITKTIGIPGAEDTAKGNYVTFQVTIANDKKESTTASGSDFNLYVNGAKHDVASVITGDDQIKPLVFEEISPNTNVTSTITFDVAEGADLKDAYLEYKPSGSFKEGVKIYLNK